MADYIQYDIYHMTYFAYIWQAQVSQRKLARRFRGWRHQGWGSYLDHEMSHDEPPPSSIRIGWLQATFESAGKTEERVYLAMHTRHTFRILRRMGDV